MTEKGTGLKIGGYPVDYDPARHGPYDPARYYGKREFVALVQWLQLIIILYNSFVHAADTPFLDLKLNEISGWISRRQKTPQAVAGAFSRGI